MARSSRLVPLFALALGAPMVVVPAWTTPASAAPPAPAAPVGLRATNTNSSVSLAWDQPTSGPRPDHFRVYEGSTVVARNTTTRVTVNGLGFLTTHTFRVTAVAANGTESALSDPITRGVYIPGMNPCQPAPPAPVRVVDVSSTAVTLGWPVSEPRWSYRISGAGQSIETSESQVRIGGLAPGSTHTFSIDADSCRGDVALGSISVSTPAGPTEWPGQPTAVAVTARTDSSVTVSWASPVGGTQVALYAIYRAGTRIATTRRPTVTLGDLWHGDQFPITVAAIGFDGAESVHSAVVTVGPSGCDGTPPAPEQVTAAAVSPSSVELRWQSRIAAASFVVLDGSATVATVRGNSARITGLDSRSRHRYRVVADLGGCGTSPESRRVTVTTPDGPTARPGAPTGLQQVGMPPMGSTPFGTVAVRWQAPAGPAPAGYRLYEGATLLGATTTQTALSTTVLPATSHLVTVVAVDAAGNESAPSNPITVTGFYLPLP
jgi:chitodextrinase